MLPIGMQKRYVVDGTIERFERRYCKVNIKEPIRSILQAGQTNKYFRMELILDPEMLLKRVQLCAQDNVYPVLLFIPPLEDEGASTKTKT